MSQDQLLVPLSQLGDLGGEKWGWGCEEGEIKVPAFLGKQNIQGHVSLCMYRGESTPALQLPCKILCS